MLLASSRSLQMEKMEREIGIKNKLIEKLKKALIAPEASNKIAVQMKRKSKRRDIES